MCHFYLIVKDRSFRIKGGPSFPRWGRKEGTKTRRYLLSQFFYYHRLRKLNFCIRNGNRWVLSDIVTGYSLAPKSLPAKRLIRQSKSDIRGIFNTRVQAFVR